MTFSLEGSGTVAPVDLSDTPPTHVALFFERNGNVRSGGQSDSRWWSVVEARMDVPGTYTFSAPLAHADWVTVLGKGTPEKFQADRDNMGRIGFTFGGNQFKGHSVCAQNGNVRFTLSDYRVE